MRRREFIALLGGAAAACPLAARAQEPQQLRRIGVLMPDRAGDPQSQPIIMAFEEELQQLGWSASRNMRFDYRWTGGDADRARAAALALMRLAPDVILTDGGQSLGELRHAALTVPIVFMEINEPVFYGFVDNLAHPGRNMTGFTGLEPAMGAKWLELLNAIAPQLTRIAVTFNSRTAPGAALFARSAEAAAQKLALEVIRAPVGEFADFEDVMRMLAGAPEGGLIVPADIFTDLQRDLVLEAAARYRLPAIYGARAMAVAGGLASYGIDRAGQFRQAARYVDRILRGTPVNELPVVPADTFELVINLGAARALGLAIRPDVLAMADTVIQ